jgi:nitroreductase
MDLQQALLERSTTHKYRVQALPVGALDTALRAAHRAPCHKLTWPWRFTILGPAARHQVGELYLRLKTAKRSVSDKQLAAMRAKVMNPAELIVVSQVRTDDAFRSREDYAACACAIQNLMLSLHGQGIASKWSTGAVTRHPELFDLIGSSPDEEELIGFIWAGYPASQSRVARPELTSVVRRTA